MTSFPEIFLWTPASLCSPRLGQGTLTLYIIIIIICHHPIDFLAWKPVVYVPCSSQGGLLKTQVRSYHYPTSVLHWLSLAVTIKSKQLEIIYKTLDYLILSATSATLLFFWLHSSLMGFCGTLRYHHSAFACAVPSTYNAVPCLFTQLDISYFSVIDTMSSPQRDHLPLII